MSRWAADGRLNCSIDYLAWWNYAVNPEPIRVHMLVARPPTEECDFAEDLRVKFLPNHTMPGYGWYATSPDDVSNLNTNNRQGLSLYSGQNVELSSNTGNYNTGKISTFGGQGSGLPGIDQGVSIEIVLEATRCNSSEQQPLFYRER